MDEDQWLRLHGLRPAPEGLADIRALLRTCVEREKRAQGTGDTELMKLCCVQLFNSGGLEDVLLIWSAKQASFDAACSIDVQLLLGRGLGRTTTYLAAHPAPAAAAALRRLTELAAHGEFDGFSVADHAAFYDSYYAGP